MQFRDEKKEGTIEFDGIKNPGMGRRATFRLVLTKPVEVEGTFERSDIHWDIKSKKAIGLKTYATDIVEAFGHKYGNEICITVPEEVINFIIEKDDEAREQIKQDKINQDFEYKLYDADTYGIYNGINEFHIEELVREIKKQNNYEVFLFADKIKDILNRDPELKSIAVETWKPYKENENWSDETKEVYRKNVELKKAAGYGIIPNAVMREKIEKILKETRDYEEENERKYNERVNELIEKARLTGEKQLISKCTVPCNDSKVECSTDICYYWAMPDGTTRETRTHTY